MPRSALLSRLRLSAALAVVVPGLGAAQQAGVFTVGQAQLGRALYDRNCAACHGSDLEGSGDAPALAGGAFMLKWGPKMVSEIFGLILQAMIRGGFPGIRQTPTAIRDQDGGDGHQCWNAL